MFIRLLTVIRLHGKRLDLYDRLRFNDVETDYLKCFQTNKDFYAFSPSDGKLVRACHYIFDYRSKMQRTVTIPRLSFFILLFDFL